MSWSYATYERNSLRKSPIPRKDAAASLSSALEPDQAAGVGVGLERAQIVGGFANPDGVDRDTVFFGRASTRRAQYRVIARSGVIVNAGERPYFAALFCLRVFASPLARRIEVRRRAR